MNLSPRIQTRNRRTPHTHTHTHTPKQNKQTQTPNSRTSTYVFNIPPDRKMFKAIPNEVGPNVAPDAMIALVSPPSTPKI